MDILRNFSRSEGAVEFFSGMVTFGLKFGDVRDFILVKTKIFSGIFRWRFDREVIDEKILIEIGKMKFDVDAIKNGTTKVFGVVMNLSGGTGARFDVRTIVTARAGVHGGEKRKVGGKSSTFLGPRNRNLVVL